MRKARVTQAQEIASLKEHINFIEQQLRVHIQSTERMLRFLYERDNPKNDSNDPQDITDTDSHDTEQQGTD
jgi:hypothetical protein